MITESARLSGSARAPRARVLDIVALVFLGALPVAVLLMVFVTAAAGNDVGTDFRQFYVAASAIVHGVSPYSQDLDSLGLWFGPYPYPPLPALAATMLTPLPFEVAGMLVMASLVVAALATLYVLDVRDWRCYGLLLLWPPVISAIQTGNVTLWLGLALAVAWRFRGRRFVSAVAIGVTLAVKLFLWPAVVWLAATRRYGGAAAACVVGAALLLASWAVIGFAGLTGYPEVLRELEERVGEDSYTAYIAGLDVGLPGTAARALWLVVGLGVLAAVVVLGRRGSDRSALILAIAAALALSPIVWLHYFALLAVVVALAQPRLGLVWFVPLGMVLTPGSGHPTPFETSWTLAIAVLTFALALRADASAPLPAPATT